MAASIENASQFLEEDDGFGKGIRPPFPLFPVDSQHISGNENQDSSHSIGAQLFRLYPNQPISNAEKGILQDRENGMNGIMNQDPQSFENRSARRVTTYHTHYSSFLQMTESNAHKISELKIEMNQKAVMVAMLTRQAMGDFTLSETSHTIAALTAHIAFLDDILKGNIQNGAGPATSCPGKKTRIVTE